MIFDGITSKLFNATVKKLQGGIDSIQTTSKATLSQAGWYRVAEFNYSLRNGCNSCFIKLSRSSSSGETHLIRVEITKRGVEFSSTDKSDAQIITKIRHTEDGTKQYVEMYINSDTSYGYGVELFDVVSADGVAWKAITPTLTSETVSGVTVTTTYDIPSNAKPVTDLDLSNNIYLRGESLNTSILAKAESLINGNVGQYNFYLAGDRYTGGDLPNNTYTYSCASVFVRGSFVSVYIWGVGTLPPIINSYDASKTWRGWQTLSTTADLANYLPLDGGGTVKKSYIIPLTLENTLADQCFVALKGHSGSLGALGVSDGLPTFADNKSNFYTLLHAGNYGDYNQFSKGITLTDASGEEGGELRFAKPLSDTSFGSIITQDIWKNTMRFHALHDGVTKLFNVDFSTMKEGVNEAFHTGNSTGIVFTEDDSTAPRSDMLWAHL